MIKPSEHLIVSDESVTIRPIQPADSAMEDTFVRNLSVETKHYRFLGGVKELSPGELMRLCDVDGHHSMAFVATVEENGLADNIAMRDLASEVGMNVRRDPGDANQVIYSLTL
jgi:hypothetical protein